MCQLHDKQVTAAVTGWTLIQGVGGSKLTWNVYCRVYATGTGIAQSV
jgi:hypothetical protein